MDAKVPSLFFIFFIAWDLFEQQSMLADKDVIKNCNLKSDSVFCATTTIAHILGIPIVIAKNMTRAIGM
jgi:hypothetical protein